MKTEWPYLNLTRVKGDEQVSLNEVAIRFFNLRWRRRERAFARKMRRLMK